MLRFLKERSARRSLSFRLFFTSLIILPTVLLITALALYNAFKSSLINAERNALQSHFYSLLSVTEQTNDSLLLPSLLGQPEFNLFDSDLYAWMSDENNRVIWQSASASLSFLENSENAPLFNASHPLLNKLTQALPETGENIFYFTQEKNNRYIIFQYTIIWPFDSSDKQFTYTIAHSHKKLTAELKNYTQKLAGWLIGLAGFILVSQFLVIRYGLKPLALLAQKIQRLEQGENQILDGEFPKEIAPIVNNLNALIEHERQQRTRYKNTLSDLAHSLKTPLAVINGQNMQEPNTKEIIAEQVKRMSDIVDHQLKRASIISVNIHAKKNLTDLNILVRRLSSTLLKVYRDKDVRIKNDLPETLLHYIDEHDALELFGNVMENACKYCEQHVWITGGKNDDALWVHICDDGPGVDMEDRSAILQRGARADTAQTGQGIGLAISIDILSSYSGSLTVEQGELKGAGFRLTLPFEHQDTTTH